MAEENNQKLDSIVDLDDEAFEAELAKMDLEGSDEVEVETNDDEEKEVETEPTEEDEIVDDEEIVDDDEEEEGEELEQPTSEDSDDDSEEGDDEEEEDKDSDTDDSTDDEVEEKPEDKPEVKEPETQEVQKRKFKANGQEFEFTKEEIETQFPEMFAKAMNYTQKMQAFAPYKGILATIKDQNLKQDDLNLLVDVLKGDKDATAALLKRTGVDALDLEPEVKDDYQPNNYGRSETELAIQEVVEEISADPEYDKTYRVIENGWDDSSRNEFAAHPQLIRELHKDVKSGVFDAVNPIATKLKVMDGGQKSDIEYYKMAGAQYYNGLQQKQVQRDSMADREAKLAVREAEIAKIEEVKAKEAKRVAKTRASKKRRAAATTSSRAGKPDALDYLNADSMSDEEFSAYMDKMIKAK